MNLEVAFAEVSERNAVRRAAGLPLLDVDAAVKAILDREQAREWGRAAKRHKDDLARLKAVLVEDYRQRIGKGQSDSFGGRLSLQIRASKLLIGRVVFPHHDLEHHVDGNPVGHTRNLL